MNEDVLDAVMACDWELLLLLVIKYYSPDRDRDIEAFEKLIQRSCPVHCVFWPGDQLCIVFQIDAERRQKFLIRKLGVIDMGVCEEVCLVKAKDGLIWKSHEGDKLMLLITESQSFFKEMTEEEVDEYAQRKLGAPEVDWRPNEGLPEDYYAM